MAQDVTEETENRPKSSTVPSENKKSASKQREQKIEDNKSTNSEEETINEKAESERVMSNGQQNGESNEELQNGENNDNGSNRERPPSVRSNRSDKERPSSVKSNGSGKERPPSVKSNGSGKERPSSVKSNGSDKERPPSVKSNGSVNGLHNGNGKQSRSSYASDSISKSSNENKERESRVSSSHSRKTVSGDRPMSNTSRKSDQYEMEESNIEDDGKENRIPSAVSRGSVHLDMQEVTADESKENRPPSSVSRKSIGLHSESQVLEDNSSLNSRIKEVIEDANDRPVSSTSNKKVDLTSNQDNVENSEYNRPLSSDNKQSTELTSEEQNTEKYIENRPGSSTSNKTVELSTNREIAENSEENRPPSSVSRKSQKNLIENQETVKNSEDIRPSSSSSKKSQENSLKDEEIMKNSEETRPSSSVSRKSLGDSIENQNASGNRTFSSKSKTSSKSQTEENKDQPEIIISTSEENIENTKEISDLQPTDIPKETDVELEKSAKNQIDNEVAQQDELTKTSEDIENAQKSETFQESSVSNDSQMDNSTEVNQQEEHKLKEENDQINEQESKKMKELEAEQSNKPEIEEPIEQSIEQDKENNEQRLVETNEQETDQTNEEIQQSNEQEMEKIEQNTEETEKNTIKDDEQEQSDKEVKEQSNEAETQSDEIEDDKKSDEGDVEALLLMKSCLGKETSFGKVFVKQPLDESVKYNQLIMDKKLPSGTISELSKQASGTEKIPEKIVFGNSKETATSSTLITHLHDSIPSSDTLGKNGDIDITDNKISESQTKISGKPANATEMQQVDSPKERVAPILKSSLSEDIPKQKSHTTTIQFAEISVDSANSTTRIPRETNEIMKTDLQRSSTVPEISLRKESVEEPVETVSTTYVDLTQISLDETNQPSSLLDWNSEKHSLYRNKTEVRSVGDLSLHMTEKTVSEKEQSLTKTEKVSSVSEKGAEEISKSKDTKPSVEKGTSEYQTEKMVSEKMPSKTVISDTSPSHVCISLKNDIDLEETKQSIKETISTFDDKKSLPFKKETEEFLTREDDLKKSEKMSEVEKRISDNNQINSAISQQKQDMTVKDQKQKDNILIKADDLFTKEKETAVLTQNKIDDNEIKTSHKEKSAVQKFEETIPKTESTIIKSTVITVQEKQIISDKDTSKKEVIKDEKETVKTQEKIISTVEDSVSDTLIKDLKTELKSQIVLSETTPKPGETEGKSEDKSKTLVDESKKEMVVDWKEKECLSSIKSQKEIQSSSLPQEDSAIQAPSLVHKEKQLLAKETDVIELSKEIKDKEKLSDAVKENDFFVTTAIVHKEEKLQEPITKEKEENLSKKQIPQKIESEVSQPEKILEENGTLPTEVSVSKIEDLSKSIKIDTVKDKTDEEKFICDKENIYPSHISTKEILEEKLDHVHKESSIVPQTKTSTVSISTEKPLEKFVDHPSKEKIDLSGKSLESKSIVSSKDEEQLTSTKQMIPETKPDVSVAKQIHEGSVAKELPSLSEKEIKIPPSHKEIQIPPSKAPEDSKAPPSKTLESGKAAVTEISQQKSLEDESKFSAKEKDILTPFSTILETKKELSSQLNKENQEILSEISKKQSVISEICEPKEPVSLKESLKSQKEHIQPQSEIKSTTTEEKLILDLSKDEESGKDQILSNIKDSEIKKTASISEVGIQPLLCTQSESQIKDSLVDTQSVTPLTDTITSKTVQSVDNKEIKVSDKNDKSVLQKICAVETKISSKHESSPINIESEKGKQPSKSSNEEYLLFSSIVSDSSAKLFQESESLKSKDFTDKASSHPTDVPKEPVEFVTLVKKEPEIISSKEKEIKMPQAFDSKEPSVSTDKYDSFVPPKEVPLPSYSDIQKEKQLEKSIKETSEENLLSQLKEKQTVSEKIESENIASKLVSEKETSLLHSEERIVEKLDKSSLNKINILNEKIETKSEEKEIPSTKEYPITSKLLEANEKKEKETEKLQESILKEIPVVGPETQKDKDKLSQVKESVLPQPISKTEHEEIFSKIIDQNEKKQESEKELFPKMELKRKEPEKEEKKEEPEKEEKKEEPEKELFLKMEIRKERDKEEKIKKPEKELFPKMELRKEPDKEEKTKESEKELFPKMEPRKEIDKEEKTEEPENELFLKMGFKIKEPEKEEETKKPEKELFPKMELKRKESKKEEKEVPSNISKEVPLQIAEKPKEKELELLIDNTSEISKSTKESTISSDISQTKPVISNEEKISDVSEKVSMHFEPKNKELLESVIKDSVGNSKPFEKQEILEKPIESKDKEETVQELLLKDKDLVSSLKKETTTEELRTLKQIPESPRKTDKTEIKDKELSHILGEINYKETIEKETLEKQITMSKDKPTSPISSPKKTSDKQSLPFKTETPQIHPIEKTKEEPAIQSKTQSSSKQKQRPLPTVGISPSHIVSTKELVETKEPTKSIMHDVNEHKIPSELPPVESIVNKQLISEPLTIKSEDVKTIPDSETVSVSDKIVTDKISLEKDEVVSSENGAPLEQETEEKLDGSKIVTSMPPLVPEDKDSQETVLPEAEETLTEEELKTVAIPDLPSEAKTIVNDVEMKILEGEVCLKVEIEKKETEESTIEKEDIHLVTDVTNITIESEREDKDTSQDESAPSSRIDDKTESVEKDTEITEKKPKKSDVPLSKEDKRKRRKFKKKEEKPFSPDRSKQISKETDKIAEQESTEKIPKSPVKKRVGRPHRSLTRKETDSTPDSSKSPPSPSKQPLQKVTSSPKKAPYARNGLLSPSKSLKGDQRKIPPIKAPVGFAPNPNLKNVKSKIGSFDNIHYKPKGGDKKVITVKKLEWHATSKIKSLENANYKPGGGDKKITTQKLEFKDKAQSKQGDSESDTDTIETLKGDKKSFPKSLKYDDETTEAQQPMESGSTDAPTTQDETTEATSPTTTTTQEVIPSQDVTA